MEEVVRGAGDVNFPRSGEAGFDMLAKPADADGVSGRASSVVGIRSCDAGMKEAWESILPEAQLAQAMRDTSRVQAGAGRDDWGADGRAPDVMDAVSGARSERGRRGPRGEHKWSRRREKLSQGARR